MQSAKILKMSQALKEEEEEGEYCKLLWQAWITGLDDVQVVQRAISGPIMLYYRM